MARVRINLSVDDADLAQIDEAAASAGEDRSSFMVGASLSRAGRVESRLDALEREVAELARYVREDMEVG